MWQKSASQGCLTLRQSWLLMSAFLHCRDVAATMAVPRHPSDMHPHGSLAASAALPMPLSQEVSQDTASATAGATEGFPWRGHKTFAFYEGPGDDTDLMRLVSKVRLLSAKGLHVRVRAMFRITVHYRRSRCH